MNTLNITVAQCVYGFLDLGADLKEIHGIHNAFEFYITEREEMNYLMKIQIKFI